MVTAMRSIAGGLVVVVLLGACLRSTTGGDSMNDRLNELASSGGSVSMRELIDQDFDSVALFNEGATPEEIEAVTGVRAVKERYLDSRSVFVVVTDGDSDLVKFSVQNFTPPSYATAVGPEATVSAPEGGGLLTLSDG